MNVLVVYDSFFGNTEKIAQAVAAALAPRAQVKAVRVSELKPEELRGLDLLVAGSPTRAFKPSPLMQSFLKSIAAGSLSGVRVAGFDTRLNVEESNSALLRFLVRLFGYAAQPIANALTKKGGRLAADPEGFYVKDSEGPLKEGELDRAADWARRLV